MTDNVVPIGSRDRQVKRAIQLATERLVRNHMDEFKRLLRSELTRSGSEPA